MEYRFDIQAYRNNELVMSEYFTCNDDLMTSTHGVNGQPGDSVKEYLISLVERGLQVERAFQKI